MLWSGIGPLSAGFAAAALVEAVEAVLVRVCAPAEAGIASASRIAIAGADTRLVILVEILVPNICLFPLVCE